MRSYRGFDMDNARWDGFEFRDGDIVISSPMKAGTTWTQMICALLVFGTPELPGRLSELSPWLDMLSQPLDEVVSTLEAQEHRRIIKTHTPLDGVPLDDRVTYVGAGRHPLDLAVSAAHHSANLDFETIFGRVSAIIGAEEAIERLSGRPIPAHDPESRLAFFIEEDLPPDQGLTLGSVLDHYRTYFATPGRVVRVHYFDLQRDLDAEMRRIADTLDIAVDEERWPSLVAAAGFDAMKGRASELVPGVELGLFKDPYAFFRSGARGEWDELLGEGGLAGYEARVAELCPEPEISTWAHHGLYS